MEERCDFCNKKCIVVKLKVKEDAQGNPIYHKIARCVNCRASYDMDYEKYFKE